MFCAKCGKDNKDDANFCAYCGMAIVKEQAPISSRGVAAKCCICGKELSPPQVHFASSGSLKPFCVGCVCKSDDEVVMGGPNEPHWPQPEGVGAVSKTDTPKGDLEGDMKTWTLARINNQLEKSLRLQEATQAALDAAAGPPFNLERIYMTARQALLAARVARDGYTGEATAAKPMPDVTTEAGMAEAAKEIQEFALYEAEVNKMLNRILAEKTKGERKG